MFSSSAFKIGEASVTVTEAANLQQEGSSRVGTVSVIHSMCATMEPCNIGGSVCQRDNSVDTESLSLLFPHLLHVDT